MTENTLFEFSTPLSKVERPWGDFTTLADGQDSAWRIKVLRVRKGEQLSLQEHHLRDEYWVLMGGAIEVTIDDEIHTFKTGERVTRPLGEQPFIPRETPHRMRALEDAIFAEISVGEVYEDDEIRIEDDYGRVGAVDKDTASA